MLVKTFGEIRASKNNMMQGEFHQTKDPLHQFIKKYLISQSVQPLLPIGFHPLAIQLE